jgi:hypothetical protein
MNQSKVLRMLCKGVVEECASKYGFDAEEALMSLEIVNVRENKGNKKSKKEVGIPMPFTGEKKEDCCHALRMNHGLYTQCTNKAVELCSSCEKEMTKNSGALPYGRIEERIAAGGEFKDPKGRKAQNYMKVLTKLKITRETVEAYANENGIVLPESVFAAEEKMTNVKSDDGKRGRPKKPAKVVISDESEDLFAGLVENSIASYEDLDTTAAEETAKAEKKASLEAEKLAKAEKKAAEEAARAEKKAALEAEKLAKAEKLEAEKKEKADKLEAEKLAKADKLEAEKLAKAEKKAAEEAARAEKKAAEEAAKAEKKAALEAEKLAKAEKKAAEEAAKAEKKAALEAKKAEKSEKKTKKPEKKTVEKKAEVSDSESDDEEDEVTVTKFEFGGKKYLKSSTNVLYDAETQDEIGVWNEAKQEIEFAELEEEEEEE